MSPSRTCGNKAFASLGAKPMPAGRSRRSRAPASVNAVVERLVLWDIDGTLVRAGDVAAAVFDRALEAALGHAPAHRISMSGKTDPQIVMEYLELMGIASLQVVPDILDHLALELAAAQHRLAAEGRVCTGVREVLAGLAADGRCAQSVLTGNIAANAALKLTAFGLERWLDLEAGAFGSDHADRRELVPIALARQRTLRARELAPEQVWVIGDTPNDLACARAGGVRCLLVATGRYRFDQLATLGADAVLADLGNTDDVLDVLARP